MDFIDHAPYHTSVVVVKREYYTKLTSHLAFHTRSHIADEEFADNMGSRGYSLTFLKLGVQSRVCLSLLSRCACHFSTRTHYAYKSHSSFVIGYVCYLLIHAYSRILHTLVQT